MATLQLVGFFVASKVGKTGLADVAVDVWRVTIADGTSSEIVTAGACTEIGDGLYRYTLAGADLSLYQYFSVFKTADSSVDAQHVAAMGLVVPDELVSSRAPASTALTNATWTDARAGYLTGAVALEATLTALMGAGWSTETLVALDALLDAIKAKTDALPASPAAVGSAMTLTTAYDPAKTAAQAGDAMALTPAERTSLASAVWAATTRTLSSFGTLIADVWAYVIRTLTTPAQTAETQAEAGALEIVRGVTWNASLTSVSFPATWVTCLFTVKGPGYEDDADDSGALVQIRLSKPGVGTDGLIRLGGAAATAAQGSITANEAGGALALVLNDEATVELATRTGLSYDVKFLLAAGSSVRERIGSLAVVATPTVTRG